MAVKNYKQLKQELDEVILKLENEDMDIDQATVLYAEAKKIITELEKQLEKKDAVIKKLAGK